MRSMFAILLTLAGLGLSGFVTGIRILDIDGKLVIHGHEKRKCSFEMLVKSNDQLVSQSKIDSSGRFRLSFTPSADRSYDFFYIDSHHAADTIFLKSFDDFETDPAQLTFYTFKGVMAVDEEDRVLCPICQQSDRVTPLEGRPGYYQCAKDRIKF